MKKPFAEILKKLPYSKPFLFVEDIIAINENGVTGTYTFTEDEYFYEGHFKGNPVTPGVILTECMAQIGLVCLGIYVMQNENATDLNIALSSHSVDFYKPVFPNEEVTVISEKVYFRFHKLNCNVKMLDSSGSLVAKGTISGMIVPK